MSKQNPQIFNPKNLQVVKFNSTPVPKPIERRGRDWILFGERNEYRNYLISLYQRSGKHNAIVNGKVYFIIGKGWALSPSPSGEGRGEVGRGEVGLANLISKPNPDESLKELASKAALDLELFNGFALEIIHSRIPGKGIEINHIPFQKVCPNKDLSRFYYTGNWNTSRPELNEDWVEFEAYNPNKKSGRQLLWYASYGPAALPSCGPNIYPYPDYIGCIPYIEADYEIANFHLNNIRNSFCGNFLINLYNGQPTDEDQREIEKRIQHKFTGSDNAGRFVLNFADSKERGAEIHALEPAQFDTLFVELNKTVQQEIFTGHKVTSPMLFGIRTEGQLGGRQELLEAYELFKNTYINHRRQIIEEVFNRLIVTLSLSKGGVKGQVPTLKLIPTDPVNTEIPLSDNALLSIFTRDELRQIAAKQLGITL
jgi:hypothetical protein